jgi:hypothetical protein
MNLIFFFLTVKITAVFSSKYFVFGFYCTAVLKYTEWSGVQMPWGVEVF